MSMSQSQNNGSNGAVVDASAEEGIEDLVYSLMAKSGYLSQMKSQIAKFVQDNGAVDSLLYINPERADVNILTSIYEYLKYVGLRNTCVQLLCESPLKIDEPENMNQEQIPYLVKLFASNSAGGHNININEGMDTSTTLIATPAKNDHTFVKSIESQLLPTPVQNEESQNQHHQSRESVYYTPPENTPDEVYKAYNKVDNVHVQENKNEDVIISMPATPRSMNSTNVDEDHFDTTIISKNESPLSNKSQEEDEEEVEKYFSKGHLTQELEESKEDGEMNNMLSLSELLEAFVEHPDITLDCSVGSESKVLSSCDYNVNVNTSGGGSLKNLSATSNAEKVEEPPADKENPNISQLLVKDQNPVDLSEKEKEQENDENVQDEINKTPDTTLTNDDDVYNDFNYEADEFELESPEKSHEQSPEKNKEKKETDHENENTDKSEGGNVAGAESGKTNAGTVTEGDVSISELLGELNLSENTTDHSILSGDTENQSFEYKVDLI